MPCKSREKRISKVFGKVLVGLDNRSLVTMLRAVLEELITQLLWIEETSIK